MNEKNFTEFLSEIKRDSSGKIIAASATYMNWIGTMNMTDAIANPVAIAPEPVNAKTYSFEEKMLKVMLNSSDFPQGKL